MRQCDGDKLRPAPRLHSFATGRVRGCARSLVMDYQVTICPNNNVPRPEVL